MGPSTSYQGPKYGYYPTLSKTYIIVKHQIQVKYKLNYFPGPTSTLNEAKHLVAVIGSVTFRKDYIGFIHKLLSFNLKQDIQLT